MKSQQQLPLKPLICYSVGNVTLTAIYGFLGSFLLKYYTDYVKLDPAWIGWALLIRSVVDAVIDPIIGYWSDRTQLPQGRRRPYFIIGAIPAAILFYLMMTPPNGSQTTIFVYLIVTSSLMVCFLSLMGITHLAMGFEMTNDYDERTRIFGYKNQIENLTILLATFSVPVALKFNDWTVLGHTLTRTDCYCLAAGVLAVISVGAALVAYFGTSEPVRLQQKTKYHFAEGLLGVFKNKAFRILLAVFVLVTIADRVVSAELFIVIEQFHGLREENSISLLIGFFIGGLVSVWPWVWLAQRYGKDNILRFALVLWPLTCVAFVVQQWTEIELCVVAFGIGVSGTGMLTIFGSIVPDVLEYENSGANQSREGLYVSVGNVVYQIAMGIGFFVSGQTLHLIGYHGETSTHSSPDLVFWLRVTFAAIPVLLSASALIAFAYFPITKRCYLALVNPIVCRTEVAS